MSTEYAWVIERGESDPSAPKYWAAGSWEPSNSYAWTSNHEEAIRFAREIDARRVAERIMKGMDVRVCEHAWG